MILVVSPTGEVHCLYSEAMDLAEFGAALISRASHVEPDEQGRWFADLHPVNGPCLGPFTLRSQALAAEQSWLETNWL